MHEPTYETSVSISELPVDERLAFIEAIQANVFWDRYRFPNGVTYHVQKLVKNNKAGLPLEYGFQCYYVRWQGQWIRISCADAPGQHRPGNTLPDRVLADLAYPVVYYVHRPTYMGRVEPPQYWRIEAVSAGSQRDQMLASGRTQNDAGEWVDIPGEWHRFETRAEAEQWMREEEQRWEEGV